MTWDLSLFSEAERRERYQQKKDKEDHLKRLYENFHIKRLLAEIRIQSSSLGAPAQLIPSRILSCDFAPGSARLFLRTPILAETAVSFTILENERIYIRGEIQWCKRNNINSSIHFKEPFPFRAEIQFTFDSLIEKENIRVYADRFHQRFVRSGPPLQKRGKLFR